MYKPNYFKAYEFVPPLVYGALKEESFSKIDDRILIFMDHLRGALGRAITINTWFFDGKFSQRGLRTEESGHYVPVTDSNRSTNNHPQGKAVDFDVEGMSAKQVRDWIIKNRNLSWIKPITFIEDDVNWVHVDVRTGDDLVLWSPKTRKAIIYSREAEDVPAPVYSVEEPMITESGNNKKKTIVVVGGLTVLLVAMYYYKR